MRIAQTNVAVSTDDGDERQVGYKVADYDARYEDILVDCRIFLLMI